MIALAKVKRIPGDNGKDGIDGAAGADGINGIDGLRGADGAQGAKGLDGSKGEIGAVGPQGDKGEAGMVWRGTYRSDIEYDIGDVVGVNGSAYVCVGATNQAPPVGFGWELLVSRGAQGVRGIKGEDGAAGSTDAGKLTGATLATNVTQSSLTKVGTLANLTVTNTINGSITGNANTADSATNALTAASATTAATVTTAAQPAITSVGTLTAINTSGVITGTNTTASTSSTTGAVIVAGGVGVAGSLNVGGTITGSSVTGMFGQYAYSASALQYDGLLTVVPKYGSPNININNASGVASPNQVVFNLIHISTTVTINKILSYCGTGGGGTGNVLYGIYSVSSIGLPNTKLYGSGSIAFTAAAATQVSVTGVATQLVSGWYFLAAIYSDTAGAHVYSLSTEVFPAFGQMSSVMTSRSRCIFYDDSALAYGFTLQSSYPTANMYIEKRTTTVGMPALYFEIA